MLKEIPHQNSISETVDATMLEIKQIISSLPQVSSTMLEENQENIDYNKTVMKGDGREKKPVVFSWSSCMNPDLWRSESSSESHWDGGKDG